MTKQSTMTTFQEPLEDNSEKSILKRNENHKKNLSIFISS